MAERISALTGHYEPGRFGEAGDAGVILQEVRDLILHQVAAWPDSIDNVGEKAAAMAGTSSAPGPCLAIEGSKASLLRIEPLKWWVYGAEAQTLDAEQGATLDMSHSRTHIRITGEQATTCLNRLLPIDLREQSFPVGSVASTTMHHVGITLWRSSYGYELFIPRGFALSLWEILLETAVQFGVEVL